MVVKKISGEKISSYIIFCSFETSFQVIILKKKFFEEPICGEKFASKKQTI